MSHLVSYWWFRKTQVIPEYVVFYKYQEGCGEGVCVSYKYLHLTGLWLGVMDRDNATDRNVYLIPHPSSLASISFRCSFFSFRFQPSSRNLLVISKNLLLECFFIRWKQDFPSSKEVRSLTYLCILSIRLWLFTSRKISFFDLSSFIYSIYSSGFNPRSTIFRELLWLHLKQR